MVEIVEEAVGDETEKVEENKQQTETDTSRTSSSSSFKISSSSEDLLWTDIELAERYMVSAMYEEAVSTASTTLQTLSSQMHVDNSRGLFMNCWLAIEDQEEEIEKAGESGKSNLEAMLDSAGMVLLQSYHALGRVGKFFDTLRSLNIGIAELPPTLLLSGACLQISSGAISAARGALEEFLAVWSIAHPEENPVTIPAEKDDRMLHASAGHGMAATKMHLMAEKYADVVELYVIQVLVKGLQKLESALDWVNRANLTEERRVVILEKIQLLTEIARKTKPVSEPRVKVTTTSTGSPAPAVAQAPSDGIELEKIQETKGDFEQSFEASDGPGANGSSLRFKSLALLKKFRISEGFFSLRTLIVLALARLHAATSTWQPVLTARLEGRVLSIGAVVSLFLFLLLRERHSLRRFTSEILRTVKIGLRDFWQQAFSVQINPLAALEEDYWKANVAPQYKLVEGFKERRKMADLKTKLIYHQAHSSLLDEECNSLMCCLTSK